ncbi:AAA family ATPase [Xanthomonas oryzae]|uniref:AAA family ATPase n=1 Tax=Xanthomonas oryzae TaxID=347 RepID=UPI0003F9E26A|nr:AAA family ATPase [Xanthomonas oryzae]AKK65487.1 chromosome segregation protein SMC [Xanthomonas oryzae pv. oryzicola]AKN99531.1 chromosome segregation protein SMC [Xanthomonas oryzae pv. oryzicola]AKO05925.1 chromosome segregation protein SMC [Xanthomonas oryzae pv. oryzicola]AKO07151.1 chromosome segregation protein SMC [Xanthomonas oryzae pv. oryzicola]KOR43279.1 chromosome segregation protein SMC [Xanthomonas oryzae]
MKIESIRLRNFKAFRDVHLKDMPSFLVVVGANGSGKSTLFDVFGFLHDCLKGNVRQALDKRGRFREVLSRGCDPTVDSILIELQYRMEITGVERLVTYSIEIGEENGAPIVQRELLRYKRGRYGSPYHFLNFSKGEGYAITNEEDFKKPDEELDRESQKVAPDTLAIKGLGQFERFKAANAFRQLIENWHVSDFHINAARGRKEATGDSEHLSESGDNLPLVAQHMNERHPQVFRRILDIMARRVPGVASVEPKLMDDGYLTLRFQDGSFKTPFLDRYVSDGTIKMFAYLVLLYDPSPHPLLCVEEPENQLYPQLMTELAEEFRMYAERGGQVLVSTHSPDFLNSAELDEACWLVKRNGCTEVHRARDNQQISSYVKEGDQLGYLWKQGFFDGVDPQ